MLQYEEYGYLPPKPESLDFEVQEDYISKSFCAGKARAHRIVAVCRWGEREFRFPFSAVIPTAEGTYPFLFILISVMPCPIAICLPRSFLVLRLLKQYLTNEAI